MSTRITVIINDTNGAEALKRTLRTVDGWTGRKIIVKAGKKAPTLPAGTDWILGLNSGEEVSIPLKRAIRRLFFKAGEKHLKLASVYSFPVIRNVKDTWKLVCPGSRRLYRRRAKGNEGYIDSPIRDYIKHVPEQNTLSGLNIRRVLVIKLRGLGDTVLLTPTLAALKKSFPGVTVDVVVKKESAELLRNHPDVDNILKYDGFTGTVFKLIRKKYDLAIAPQASGRSALLAKLSGADMLSVNNHNGKNHFSSVLVDKPEEYEDAVDRDLDCLRALGLFVEKRRPYIELTGAERIKASAVLEKIEGKGKKAIIVNPSASKANKMWPSERFAAFLDKAANDKKFKAVLLTDPNNPGIAPRVASRMKRKATVIGASSLREVLGLLSAAKLYIGNDSGLTHAAAALRTPTLTVIGPDEPEIFHPYREADGNYFVSKDIYCKPCWKKECRRNECLSAARVADVYKEYLKWKRSA